MLWQFHTIGNLIRFDLAYGRYFTEQEIEGTKNYVILGHNIAQSLLNNLDKVGEVIKTRGEKSYCYWCFF